MPENPQLAQAYIPYQVYMGILPAIEGLHKGTVFPELYRPYHMK
ncbi:MAG: spore coat associated protein CotJA [Ruminiclostridium sp.]|nr:spore coat associated protein CotJA [Ruminiclostridium sp.]